MLALMPLYLGPTLPVLADKGGIPNANASGNAGGGGNGAGNSVTAPNSRAILGRGSVLPSTGTDIRTMLPAEAGSKALSLAEIRRAVGVISDGRILDIRLLTVDGRLVYDVTLSEAQNVVRHLYLDARSGRQLRAPN